METPPCSLCGTQSGRLFDRFGIPIRGCATCELRFADFDVTSDHTSKFYADDYFDDGQDGYVGYLSNRTALFDRGVRYAQFVARHAPARGHVLDVGAAAGFLLKAFVDDGWTGEGIEPNPKMAQYGRDEFGLDIRTGTLGDAELAPGSFDLVNLIQVLSHFPSPTRALEKVSEITKVGGHCLIETWDYQSLSARLAGQAWHQYSPPRVLFWFTRGLVTRLLEKVGFRFVSSGRATKKITGRHAKALASHARNGSFSGGVVHAVAKLVPDAAAIPYPGNDCFWALYEKC